MLEYRTADSVHLEFERYGSRRSAELHRFSNRAPGFRAWYHDSDGRHSLSGLPSPLFRGRVNGDPLAEAVVFDVGGQFFGVVSYGDERAPLWIEPEPGANSGEHRIAEAVPPAVEEVCTHGHSSRNHHGSAPGAAAAPGGTLQNLPEAESKSAGSVLFVPLVLDGDVEFYQDLGLDVAGTQAYMEGVLGVSSALYESYLGVVLQVAVVDVWTDPSAPGYPHTPVGPCYSTCTGAAWADVFDPFFAGVHVFSGKTHIGNPGILGQGKTDSLCERDPWRMTSWSRHPDTGIASATMRFAHEAGHTAGCRHEPTGVMAQGDAKTWAFDPQNVLDAAAYLPTVACLQSGAGSPAPTVSSITPGTATQFEDTLFTIAGTQLGQVIQVEIGDVLVDRFGLQSVSETEIQFVLVRNTLASLGTKDVVVTTASGQASTTVSITGASPPDFNATLVDIGSLFLSFEVGGQPQSVSIGAYNTDGATYLSGGVELLQNRILIDTVQLNHLGANDNLLTWPVPSSVGNAIHVQFTELFQGGGSAVSAIQQVSLTL